MLSYSSSRGVWVFSATLQFRQYKVNAMIEPPRPSSDAHVLSHYGMNHLALVVALVTLDNVLS